MTSRYLIISGFLIHAVLFLSVFDIFFWAPLLGNLPQHASPLKPPAKRVVFIVADGLRADKILTLQPDGSTPAPYIRKLAEKGGRWGVSVAGVPTATRPGHVALTAGFYEDPTSVAKDIGGADILFDTVFNETRYTWSWDTPQFLSKVASDHPNRVFSKKYPGDRKYLAGIHPIDMDSWVFDEFDKFIDTAVEDEVLAKKLNEDKLMFFLHLGGIDHAGYIVRPNAPEYLKHVSFIDSGVRKTVEKIEKFYDNDGQTSFLFTSDHGMTNWGAHGDGTPEEIRTPLVVWGSGIKKAEPEDSPDRFTDTLSYDWDLEKYKRTDIEQASIAPLLAGMIGVPYPKNAIYPVPYDMFSVPEDQKAELMVANLRQLSDHYLALEQHYPVPYDMFSVPEDQKAELMFANLRQLSDHYLALEKHVHHGLLAFNFRAFTAMTKTNVGTIRTDIETLIKLKNYVAAIEMIEAKIELTTQGIRHYRNYSRGTLGFSAYNSIVAWLCVCALYLIHQHQNWEDIKVNTPLMANTKHIIIQCACAVTVFFFLFLYTQSTPFMHMIIFLLPVPLWFAAILKWYEIGNIMPIIKRQQELLPMAGLSCLGIAGVVLSFRLRAFLSLVMVGYAFWPYVVKYLNLEKSLQIQWSISMCCIAVLVGRPFGDRDLRYSLVLFSGIAAIAIGLYIRLKSGRSLIKGRWFRDFGRRFITYQIITIGVATAVLYHTSYLTANDVRTPLLHQTLSWAILVLAMVQPFFVSTEMQSRLLTMVTGFISPFILLSIGQEPLYYIFLAWNCYLMIEVEKNVTKSQPVFLPSSAAAGSNPAATAAGKATGAAHLPNGAGGGGGASSSVNGHPPAPPVKAHKHTKSTDITMAPQSISEWQTLDFAKAEDADQQCKKMITAGDLRRTLYLLMLGVSTVFGTGHIASVNSFDTTDVFCFITISNPPRMGTLMVFKILIPGMVLCSFYKAVCRVTFMSMRNTCLLLMIFSNIAGAFTMWAVDVDTSWTVAGETVSHHVLVQGIGMFVSLQFGLVHFFTTKKFTMWAVDVDTSWTVAGETVSHHVLVQGIGMFVSLQFGLVHFFTTKKV